MTNVIGRFLIKKDGSSFSNGKFIAKIIERTINNYQEEQYWLDTGMWLSLDQLTNSNTYILIDENSTQRSYEDEVV